MINRRESIKRTLQIFAACVAFSATAHAADVSVHGSTTVASNLLMPKKAQIEKASGHSLSVVANGSSRGVMDLVSGKADMAMISATLDATVAKLNKKKPGSVDGGALQAHQVGKTEVGFVVHPSNPVKSLTMAQLGDIMSGKITNWKDVGGKDGPIVVVAETKGGGVRTMAEKALVGGGDISAKTRDLPNATQVVKVVSQMPQGLGIGVKATADSSVALVQTDQSIEQPLILVTKGAPSPEMAKVIEAARKAGS